MLDGICKTDDKYSIVVNENKVINIDSNGWYDLYIKSIDNITINIKAGIKAIINQFQYDENTLNIKMNVADSSRIGYYIYSYKSNSKNTYIDIDSNVYLKVYNVEIGDNTNIEYDIKLNGENTFLDYNFLLYSDSDNNNNFKVKIDHLNKNTRAFVNNVGVLNDNARCVFDVSNYIKSKCSKSHVKQTSTVLSLSDSCSAKINPILLIDEYDVSATHAAKVSKVREEELYYMMSRGIEESEAKKLISIGYLLNNAPKHIRESLNTMIEKRIRNERI